MLQSYSRLSQVSSKLPFTRLVSRRSFTVNPCRFSSAVEHVPEEPPKEQPKLRWFALTGIGLLGVGVIGCVAWLANAEEPQVPQLDVFQDYELLKNKRISNSSNLLTIQPSTFGSRAYKSSLENQKVAEVSQKGIWSVQIKHPLLTIARLYTPLPPFLSDVPQPAPEEKFGFVSANPEENQLRFLIRNNPEGELSRYLSRMQAGGRLELRGPYQEFEIPQDIEYIIFLAGGTGISPAIQMVHSILDNNAKAHKPRIHILWANRRSEDCSGGSVEPPLPSESVFQRLWSRLSSKDDSPLMNSTNPYQPESPIVRELSTLKARYTGTLDVSYFADDQQRFITRKDIHRRLLSSAQDRNGRVSGQAWAEA